MQLQVLYWLLICLSISGPAQAAAHVFGITAIVTTVANIAAAVALIGAAMLLVTLARKAWGMIRGGVSGAWRGARSA